MNNLINPLALGKVLNKYNLIIDTDLKHKRIKSKFGKRIIKNYYTKAYITIINHSLIKNNVASQIFTTHGPLAFLPMSNNKTSIVFSVFDRDLIKDNAKIVKLIKHYNRLYNIKKISELQKFPINLSLSRNYFYRNILSLHKIHPLAGQGFNMTLRDAKILSKLIQENLDLGINLDTILDKFEINRKNSNFIFAMGVDFVHEFFKFNNKYNMKSIDNLFKLINKNLYIKKKIENFANKGFII